MVDDKYDIIQELKPGVFVVLATYEGHQNWLYRVIRNVAGYWEEAHCEDSKEVGVMPTEGWGWEDSGTRENDVLYDAALIVWRKNHPHSNEIRLIEWLLSEEWAICDSKTHLAIDADEISRSFVAYFPDASVLDSRDLSIENVPFGPASGLAPDAKFGNISFSDSENSKVTAANADDLVVEKKDGSLEIMTPYRGEMVVENKWFDSTSDSGMKETLRQMKRDIEFLAKAHKDALKERADHLALKRMDEALRRFLARKEEN